MFSVTSLLLFGLLTFVTGNALVAVDCCEDLLMEKAACCDAKTLCLVAPQDPCRQVTVKIGDDDVKAVRGSATLALVGADDERILLREHQKAPKVWIGVRVTTVPESLASHLGRGGLMIANVAVDSPADRAGIERYDVVVSFAGDPIEGMDDLVTAIADNGPDNEAKMVVIGHGKEKTLTITPVTRDLTEAAEFKYEEPEEAKVGNIKDYFGHLLKLGPDGQPIVIPHGRLDQLPEDVEELLEDLPKFHWEHKGDWQGLKDLPFDIKLEFGAEGTPELKFFAGDFSLDDLDASVQIRIEISEDGKTITIERDEDGTITVEREDADGKRSSNTYENADELREDDPEAYETYRRCRPGKRHAFIVAPKLKDLGTHQKEFQIELKRQLEKAREQLEDAGEQLHKARKRIEIHKGRLEDTDDLDVDVGMETVMIFVDDEGRITLTIKKDGVTKKYEFKSRQDFEKSEPELYKRFYEELEGEGHHTGARGGSFKVALASRIA